MSKVIILAVLLSYIDFVLNQDVNRVNKSFTVCNSIDGSSACAMDVPDKTISMHLNALICPVVMCAWECQLDPRCLEFNVHSDNWICELYYNQPMYFQPTEECTHFQVFITIKLI